MVNKTYDSRENPFFATFYESEGYDISQQKLMGRQAAGRSYLSALLNSDIDPIPIVLNNSKSAEIFKKDMQSLLSEGKTKSVELSLTKDPIQSSRFGGIFFPGPSISKFANERMFFGHEKYSLAGITHTTASQQVMDSFTSILTNPVMPWDALICTSQCVRDTVDKVINKHKEYLKDRVGASKFTLPQFPIIPLGVDPEYFLLDENKKNNSRKEHNFSDDDIVVIFVGRLSFHAKAHPFPMYLSLENAQKKLPKNKKIHLLQVGWFSNDFIKKAFEDEAKKVCPNIEIKIIDGRNQKDKFDALACSDIFVSMSDNIQETFGLTPLEGMASGLPVIATDWNGYRDTIRNNLDGFLIPTYTMPSGNQEDIASNHLTGAINYDYYIGLSSIYTAVDIPDSINKMSELILNDDLRKKMGKQARDHAKEEFFWPLIIEKYKDLYKELADIRKNSSKEVESIKKYNLPSSNLDPSYIFESYPSFQLNNETILQSVNLHEITIKEIYDFESVSYIKDFLPKIDILENIHSKLETKKSIDDLTNIIGEDISIIYKAVSWLLKFGFLKVSGNKND